MGGRGVLREKKSHRMGTHIHSIHQPIINSGLETFKKAIFLLTNYCNSSNYEVELYLFSPPNHHDSPIRFLLLSKSGVNLGVLNFSDFNRGRISSVGRAFDCRTGGRGFDSRGRTITQGLKMTEKWRYFLCTASGETFAWLGWPRKMAVPSPLGDVKIVSPISTFVLNTLTRK